MVNGFSTKKIKSEKTLAEIFKKARVDKGISLFDAEIGTKVRAKFLTALEQSNWQVLPQDIYVRGFVLAYAKFLELPTTSILEQYEKEAKIRRVSVTAKISYNQPLKERRVLITPKVLAYAGLSIFFISLFSYIVFQVLNFAGNPNLKIVSPSNNLVTEDDSIDLVGITDTDTMVVVNSENIPVSDDGKFSLKLKLHSGVNVVKVRAINKIKKESSEVYTIEYKPKTAALDGLTNQ